MKLFFFLIFFATQVFAQEFPSKPLRIVVPYAAGGGTDAVARLMATRLQTTLGQPVVVENKPGASANIGTDFVAKAAPDGYTILVTAPNFATSEALFDKLGWKFEDFIPVIHLVRYEQVLVAATQSQIASVQAMIAQAKAKPGSLTYGTPGTASNSHLGIELLKQRAGFGMQPGRFGNPDDPTASDGASFHRSPETTGAFI